MPAGVAGDISFPKLTFSAGWLLFGVRFTPVLPQWHVKKNCGHSAKKCKWQVATTHVNTLDPTKLEWPLIMLSRHSVKTSLRATRLSSLSHCKLILASKGELLCASYLHLKKTSAGGEWRMTLSQYPGKRGKGRRHRTSACTRHRSLPQVETYSFIYFFAVKCNFAHASILHFAKCNFAFANTLHFATTILYSWNSITVAEAANDTPTSMPTSFLAS